MQNTNPETHREVNTRRDGAIRFGERNVVTENERFLPQWEYRFNVSRDTQVKVVFIGGHPTQEAVDKLAKLLEVQRDTFPSEAELRQAEQDVGLGG